MTASAIRLAAVAWVLLAPAGVVAQEEPRPRRADQIRGLLAAHEWRRALDDARAFHAEQPDTAEAKSVLGEALLRAGRLAEAATVLEALERAGGAPARGLVALARVRDAEGRSADAQALLQAALAQAPEERDVLYWAARSTGSRAVAIERFERYLERAEGDDADRVESARGVVGFYRALGDRAIWVDVRRPEHLELPLAPIWEPRTGAILGFGVRVRLGERKTPVTLLLDSGSPGLLVVERIARKHGFAPLAQQTSFGGGRAGRHATTRGTFSEVAIGDLAFADALATTTRSDVDPLGRFHGYLGLGPFQGYRITLDLPRRRLVLDAGGSADEAGAPYWEVDGQWLVEARAVGGEIGVFLLDTGATHSVLGTTYAATVPGARPGSPVDVRGVGGRLPEVRALHGTRLAFAGVEAEGDELRVADLSVRSRLGGIEVSGLLGLELLGSHVIVLDTRVRRIALEKSGR